MKKNVELEERSDRLKGGIYIKFRKKITSFSMC